jgi:hypothetical protein
MLKISTKINKYFQRKLGEGKEKKKTKNNLEYSRIFQFSAMESSKRIKMLTFTTPPKKKQNLKKNLREKKEN